MLHQLSERDADRLLSGERPLHRPDLVEVAQLVATLRASTEAEAPPMRPQLLAELDAAEAAGPGAGRDAAAALAAAFGDELGRRRKDAPRQDAPHDESQSLVGAARRRWRLLGAAAMVAMLCGVVAAHAHGAFLPADRDPTHTTDVDPSDRNDPKTGTEAQVPTTTAPPVTTTVPPPAPPAPPAQATVGDGSDDRDSGDGDGDGRRRRWDEDRRSGNDGEVFVPGHGWVDINEVCGYDRDGDCWSGEFDRAWEWWYGSDPDGP